MTRRSSLREARRELAQRESRRINALEGERTCLSDGTDRRVMDAETGGWVDPVTLHDGTQREATSRREKAAGTGRLQDDGNDPRRA
jgi:hypothetical protein